MAYPSQGLEQDARQSVGNSFLETAWVGSTETVAVESGKPDDIIQMIGRKKEHEKVGSLGNTDHRTHWLHRRGSWKLASF